MACAKRVFHDLEGAYEPMRLHPISPCTDARRSKLIYITSGFTTANAITLRTHHYDPSTASFPHGVAQHVNHGDDRLAYYHVSKVGTNRQV